jgi:hypothetical protein
MASSQALVLEKISQALEIRGQIQDTMDQLYHTLARSRELRERALRDGRRWDPAAKPAGSPARLNPPAP